MFIIPALSSFLRHYMTLVAKNEFRAAGDCVEELAQYLRNSPFCKTVVVRKIL